jgi:putative iron-only hydrogenase system regulator
MENRIALLAVIVEETDSTESLNAVLHEYSRYIVGRMGIPYRERKIGLISVAVDAPSEIINALCGRLGKLPGVTAKAVYAKLN